jgi:hypothetical protein
MRDFLKGGGEMGAGIGGDLQKERAIEIAPASRIGDHSKLDIKWRFRPFYLSANLGFGSIGRF